jgi:hypothetical protein
MTGVELPDYSILYWIAVGVWSLATSVWILTRTKGRDSKYLKSINDFLDALLKNKTNESKAEYHARNRMEERIRAKFKRPGKISKRLAMWNQRPHLKEDAHLCGFTEPGVWQCRCGKLKCETFGNLCKAVGGTDATPPQKCGLRNPGEWECNCGGGLSGACDARMRFNAGMEALGSDMTPVPPSPTEQPMPDRKAAIAHSKAKS